MKLLVIVLCLLSERFLVHVEAHNRFRWFSAYINATEKQLSKIRALSSQWIILLFVVLPFVVIGSVILYFFSDSIFGFVGLLLNILILYSCLGPGNPFYPVHVSTTESASCKEIGEYLGQVNGQLFAVLFWYILLGPLAALVYRFISQCRHQSSLASLATKLTDILDWLPVRMAILLYLLVGNFQVGFRVLLTSFFKAPANNQILLSGCGLKAIDSGEASTIKMAQAENLVEHAVILLLVLLAFFTLVAWM